MFYMESKGPWKVLTYLLEQNSLFILFPSNCFSLIIEQIRTLQIKKKYIYVVQCLHSNSIYQGSQTYILGGKKHLNRTFLIAWNRLQDAQNQHNFPKSVWKGLQMYS